MNKTAIKNFAVWARRKLIKDVTTKCGILGINEDGIAVPQKAANGMQIVNAGTPIEQRLFGDEIKKRDALVSAINERKRSSDYKTAFQSVVEEVAYTWFNRLIAIRFMEVNDYLPSRIRVLSSMNPAKLEPDFVTTPFDTDLVFSGYERDRITQLKDENKLDELFRILFVKQCNKLNEILPELFEKTDDYTEMLLTLSFTDKDGVVYHLTHDIAEDDFDVSKEGQVEIIGWMYQYYNTEPKDEVFALLKKNVKITKERIPAATQLFTPDWIVRYMVENSLGRLWIEGHENKSLKDSWKYYLDEAKQEPEVEAQLAKIRDEYKTIKPEDIKIIDPCMGSGHILVYAFDVLMQIYTSQGYIERDAAKSIVENNLYGLDIDTRAYQLAYFAVMMKARQYNRRILSGDIKPSLYAIDDSSVLNAEIIGFIANGNASLKNDLQSIADDLVNAKEYGSIIDVAPVDFTAIYARIDEIRDEFYQDIMVQDNQRVACEIVLPLIKQAEVMAQKYDVVVTNPPYMGASGMSAMLSNYVKTYYPDSKSDMSTVCMEKTIAMCKQNGRMAMINIPVWMFLSSYEKLRQNILTQNTIINMVHPGRGIFGSDFGTTSFIISKSHIAHYVGSYRRLFEKQGEVESIEERAQRFFEKRGSFESTQDNFSKIPGSPIAYWVSEKLFKAFENGKALGNIASVPKGLSTGSVDIFMRFWFEVSRNNINLRTENCEMTEKQVEKWYPYAKGGSFRKWSGNLEYVVNWKNNGYEVKHFVDEKGKQRSRPQNTSFYFKKCLTYSAITSYKLSLRYLDNCIFGGGGDSIHIKDDSNYLYVLGFINSELQYRILSIISPTINYEVDHLKKLPIIIDQSKKQRVDTFVQENIDISKTDWDSFETSWDFGKHPLVANSIKTGWGDKPASGLISASFDIWDTICSDRFNQLKANEEELNRIFIDIYGLQDELTPEVEDKDVTVRKADKSRDIKSLISYAVGCMFGRYSLDVDGLAYAGGEWDESKYKSFIPDSDNCIPITDEEYFGDDIVGRFVQFIKTVYGEETLEANLDFIASALGGKGNTSREVIRNYFLNDFIADHNKIYQKRPIYWMYDSGKQNGFKAIVYMHRYNADTTGNVRVEYLHRMQRIYESEIARMKDMIDNSTNAREVSAAQKRSEKLIKQLKETKDYDSKLAHIALSRIAIDLDDGVKVNYDKVQTGQDGKIYDILAKI